MNLLASDQAPTATGYRSFSLLTIGTQTQWTDTASATLANLSNTPLINPPEPCSSNPRMPIRLHGATDLETLICRDVQVTRIIRCRRIGFFLTHSPNTEDAFSRPIPTTAVCAKNVVGTSVPTPSEGWSLIAKRP